MDNVRIASPKILYLPVDLAENVENEWFNVEVKSFMVEEEFGKETQVLAVQFIIMPVNLNNI